MKKVTIALIGFCTLISHFSAYGISQEELERDKLYLAQLEFKLDREKWVGASIDDLVLDWGQPETIYERKDGGQYATFKTISHTVVDFWTTEKTYSYCYTTFISNPKGTITSWKTKGRCVYHTPD